MKKTTLIVFMLSLILVQSCKNSGYEETKSGLEYKIYTKNGTFKKTQDGTTKPKKELKSDNSNLNNSNDNKVVKSSDKKSTECSGAGSPTCYDKVAENFKNTGKDIVGSEYLENGTFGISFLEPGRSGELYNAKVYTNCRCEIINVEISIAR